jgi:ATP-dependent Lhr-like helicase
MNRGDGLSTESVDKLAGVYAWFEEKGWAPFPFQENAWRAFERGESGLIHAPTGFGKTLSAWMGSVAAGMEDPRALCKPKKRADAPPLQVLWITPMRALAQDLTAHLAKVAAELVPGWLVEVRTGDSTSTERARQKRRLPTALVTTPESGLHATTPAG